MRRRSKKKKKPRLIIQHPLILLQFQYLAVLHLTREEVEDRVAALDERLMFLFEYKALRLMA
jgi:hypothetical protein